MIGHPGWIQPAGFSLLSDITTGASNGPFG